jgi:small ubiquitin-related modifier
LCPKHNLAVQAYAQKTGANAASLRLSFDGTRLNDDDTPESLEMEDQDVVDVVLQQTGGAW